ncbi:hypothetical protein Patl1_34034 [Pistacia atlantica]|uniref:Uncharacterized protein n=1 Tax=Pistacia atlantica TaxID=434234 RepID=A0ACC0ZWU7_9ROSI|nr:hypothetical protein Patl1_34034 [Pistacia atlantica]
MDILHCTMLVAKDVLPLRKCFYGLTQTLLCNLITMDTQFDNNGYTPLHLPAMNGDVAILEEFMAAARSSFQILTKNESETVFHLALAEYILLKRKVDINYRNYKGHTALEILSQAGSASGNQHLKDQIMKAGKMGIELPQSLVPEIPKDALENGHARSLAHKKEIFFPKDALENGYARSLAHKNKEIFFPKEEEEEIYTEVTLEDRETPTVQGTNSSEPLSSSERSTQATTHEQKRQSKKHRRELIEMYKHYHHTKNHAYTEVLQKCAKHNHTRKDH